MSKNRLYTKMFRMHLFSIFKIKRLDKCTLTITYMATIDYLVS